MGFPLTPWSASTMAALPKEKVGAATEKKKFHQILYALVMVTAPVEKLKNLQRMADADVVGYQLNPLPVCSPPSVRTLLSPKILEFVASVGTKVGGEANASQIIPMGPQSVQNLCLSMQLSDRFPQNRAPAARSVWTNHVLPKENNGAASARRRPLRYQKVLVSLMGLVLEHRTVLM